MSIYFGNDTVNDLYIGLTPVTKGYVGTHLFYNGDNTIVDLTYEKYISNTQFSTLYNTAEKPIKSAILKGRTLVNVHPTDYIVAGSNITFFLSKIIPETMIKPNTRYFLRLYNTHQSIVKAYFRPCVNNNVNLISSDNKCAIFTTKSEFTGNDFKNNKIHFYSSSGLDLEDVKDTKVILCEYVDGMENWDIPYFEGMRLVKMPVLKTTGKNLFDINSISNINNWDTVVSGETPYCSYKINLKPNTTYTFSQKQFLHIEDVYASFGLEKGKYEPLLAITHPTSKNSTTFKLTTDDRGLIYVKLYRANTTLETFISKLSNNQLQLEESSTATSYEPYKSNILTVNEDVTLRSNGDVYDELNLLNGRLTKRIDENNEVLAQEVVKTVDLSVVDQDGNNVELSTFDDITHVTLSSEELIPEAELEVATKNQEVLNTMSLEMDDISATQTTLEETSNTQSENVDATMIATTEIYEQLL